MKQILKLLIIFLFTFSISCKKENIEPDEKESKDFQLLGANEKDSYTIVQYNVENLFNTSDDAGNEDTEFTPNGAKKWTKDKYVDKLGRIASVLSSIPGDKLPAIFNLNEIENRGVVEDLIKTGDLANLNYGIVHFVDTDPRGIENAIVYDQHRFKYLDGALINQGDHNYRKPLMATFLCNNGDTITIISVHFSSRLAGAAATEYKRLKSADALDAYLNKKNLCSRKCIILGDLNDNPTDKSLKVITHENAKICFTNPAEKLWTNTYGTLYYNTLQWYDHLMFSNGLSSNQNLHYVQGSQKVYNPSWISYQNKPNRSFLGDTYNKGYSDHYPVYCTLEN